MALAQRQKEILMLDTDPDGSKVLEMFGTSDISDDLADAAVRHARAYGEFVNDCKKEHIQMNVSLRDYVRSNLVTDGLVPLLSYNSQRR